MRSILLAVTTLGMVAAATAGFAQTAATPGTESTVVTETRIICVQQDAPTGSHLGAKKQCHTNAEWKEIRAQSQYSMTYMQERHDNGMESAALAAGQ